MLKIYLSKISYQNLYEEKATSDSLVSQSEKDAKTQKIFNKEGYNVSFGARTKEER